MNKEKIKLFYISRKCAYIEEGKPAMMEQVMIDGVGDSLAYRLTGEHWEERNYAERKIIEYAEWAASEPEI